MRIIPIQTGKEEYVLFMVMGDVNIGRIKSYDPVELQLRRMGPPWPSLKLKDINIVYASIEEFEMLDAVRSKDDMNKVLARLTRGWAYRPDLGDHDAPYYFDNNTEKN